MPSVPTIIKLNGYAVIRESDWHTILVIEGTTEDGSLILFHVLDPRDEQ